MIEHPQQTNPQSLDFRGLAFEELPADETLALPARVRVSGSLVLAGQTHEVDMTVDMAGNPTIFLAADGTLTTDAANAHAHVAWVDGGVLHVITHQ